ncbi:MAG TPA: hypothetical protein DCF84_06465, partial [Bacteroidetes bacterium]|nr:hypothetical protein [Bacteroidota bacterium]
MPTRSSSSYQMIIQGILVFILLFVGFFSASSQRESLNIEYPSMIGFAGLDNVKSSTADLGIPVLYLLDTVSLPFIDDFSSDRSTARSLAITSDTLLYVTGDCLYSLPGIELSFESMHTDTAWSYSYDSVAGELDSIALPAQSIIQWENNGCQFTFLDTLFLWAEYYRYIYDSLGVVIDSSVVVGDTTLSITSLVVERYASSVVWQNNGVYVNATYPIFPPSIGCATLDGLNASGMPYDKSNTDTYGVADYLTSSPINLEGLSKDSNVYLSFFYQPTGRGNFPDAEDSLVVEFLNEATGQWLNVWSSQGIDSAEVSPFTQVYIEVRDTNLLAGPRYFYNGFKFRFKNYATLSGNNDHWHIDYVRLDQSRDPNSSDTLIQDVAFIEPYPNIFTNYSQMPWQHFLANPSLEDTLSIPIRDNGQLGGITAGAMPLEAYTIENTTGDTIYALTGQNFNPTSVIRYREIYPNNDFTIPMLPFFGDTAQWNASVIVSPSNQNDILGNDTLKGFFPFSKELAYDDGSAERSYGVEGGDQVKQFAYRFDPIIDDSISALRFHFGHTDVDVSDMVFTIYLWDSLELNTTNPYENVVYALTNVTPTYVDSLNGFTTFSLDSLIPFTHTMYVGWSQVDNRNIQLGFDVNSGKGRNNMFVNLSNRWEASSINATGSPMIRLVLNDEADSIPIGVDEITSQWTLYVFPNPAAETIFIRGLEQVNEEGYEYKIIDRMG